MKNKLWMVGFVFLMISFIFDNSLIQFSSVLRFEQLTYLMELISWFGIPILVLIIYSIIAKKQRFILYFSFILAFLISYVLKLLIMRARPEDALILESGYSFPSSHASVVFSTLAIMWKELPKFKYIFLLIAVLISFSRYYLGVHYVSDLIAGGFLGYAIGLGFLNRKSIIAKFYGFFKH